MTPPSSSASNKQPFETQPISSSSSSSSNLLSLDNNSSSFQTDPTLAVSNSDHALTSSSACLLSESNLPNTPDHTTATPRSYSSSHRTAIQSPSTASKRRASLHQAQMMTKPNGGVSTTTSSPSPLLPHSIHTSPNISPNPSSLSTTIHNLSSPSSLQPILTPAPSPNSHLTSRRSYPPHEASHTQTTTKFTLTSLVSTCFKCRKIRTQQHPSRHPHGHSSSSLSGDKDTSNNNEHHPWQQVIVFEEGEQVKAFVHLYYVSTLSRYLYYLACVVTLGVVYLLSRWFPFLWIRCVGKAVVHVEDTITLDSPASSTSPSSLLQDMSGRYHLAKSPATYPIVPNKRDGAMWVCIRNSWGQIFLEPLKCSPFQGPLATIFPGDASNASLSTLVFLDYRCFRCIWHPLKKRFISNSHWKDPQWYCRHSTPVDTLAQFKRSGLTLHQAYERYQLFDLNDICIPEPSTLSLLFTEILHPFYIFQLLSILLWSLDSYYIYASCILAISIVSTTISLIETKRNMKRLRDLSHFSCQVHVLRDQQWQCLSSQELVPGDIFEINMADFSIFPCDALLLSGDCIVDESMLTGESVPVSKIHTKDICILEDMDIHEPQISKQLHKYFLYAGTHLIRVRSDTDDFTAAIPPASYPPKQQTVLSSVQHGHPSSLPPPVASTKVLAMVVRTGFNTTKGSLIRSMLFPKPHYFKFYKDSFKFIGVLFIFGFFGFIFTLYNFITLGTSIGVIIKRALDVITLIVSPIIPAAMSVGTTWAIRRLREKKVFCISPNHVNVGGKVSLACFDKTGTLTEHGLDVLGVHLACGSSFSKLYTTPQSLPQPLVVDLLASCHELKMHHQVLLGDPLDTKMFEWIGWTLEETVFATTVTSNTHPAQEIGIVKHFEFRNELRRMSVLTKKMKSEFQLFCKGAPESLKQICVPSSIPSDFDERLSSLSHHGFRVLSFAARALPNWNVVKLEKASRAELESELTFLGFLVFVNKLKPGSSEAIETLKKAKLRCVMCTGDNLFTAISVSREVGIVEKDDDVYLPQFVRDPENPACILGLHWAALECPEKTLDPITLFPRLPPPPTASYPQGVHTAPGNGAHPGDVVVDMYATLPATIAGAIPSSEKYSLGMTGEVFDYLLECEQWAREKHTSRPVESASASDAAASKAADPYHLLSEPPSSSSGSKLPSASEQPRPWPHASTEPPASSTSSLSLSHFIPAPFSPSQPFSMESFWRILYKTQIFARMNPEQKQGLVEKLQDMEYCVAFCGDGANDCGALKAADIGLSLSESEASVAAPFTSSHPEVTCVVDLIKEGRAALVTSFSTFKYIALYSFIQFTSVTLLYTAKSNLGDLQFLYVDLILIWPLAFTIGRSGPYHTLVPKRPTATLLSKKVLTSVTCNVVLQLLFQLFIFMHVKRTSFYEPSQADPEEEYVTCYENTLIFLLTSFLYISSALCFAIGPPYRAPLFSNTLFMISMVVLYGMSLFLLFYHAAFLEEHLNLLALPLWYKGVLLAVAGLHLVCTWLGESYGYVRVANLVGRTKRFFSQRLCARSSQPRKPGTVGALLSASRPPAYAAASPAHTQKVYKVIGKVFEK